MASSKSTTSDFGSLSVTEFLQYDPRPTLVLERGASTTHFDAGVLPVTYANTPFYQLSKSIPDLALQGTQLVVDVHGKEAKDFISWIENGQHGSDLDVFGLHWTNTIIHQRWQVISAAVVPHKSSSSENTNELPLSRKHSNHTSDDQGIAAPHGTFSSIILAPRGKPVSSHHKLTQNFDWSTTPLGPVRTWSAALRQTASFVLNNSQPVCLFWGEDRVLLYNEAYTSLIKDFHPTAIGASAKIIFAQFWPVFEDIFLEVERNASSVRRENVRVMLDRSGRLEEAYFTGSYMPILESDGTIGGTLNEPVEVTKEVVAQRQLVTLVKIGDDTALKTSLDGFWKGFFRSISQNCSDIPVAVIYSIGKVILSTDASSEMSLSTSNYEDLFLEGAIGFPEDHLAIPTILQRSSQDGFAPAIRLAASRSAPLYIDKDSPIFAPDILRGCEDRGAGTDISQFVVAPLRLSSEQISAWLILGINPYREYDSEYRRFFNIISRQVEDGAISVVLLERERRRLQKTTEDAEKQRKWLSEQLAQQTREAQESELRFLNFAKQSPVGVYILGPSGEVKFCNEAWIRMVGMSDSFGTTQPWRVHVHPDDLEEADRQWQSLVQGNTQTNFEWRALVSDPHMPEKEPQIRYLRSSCFPELADDGTMKTVTGILMDVSVHKAHEKATAERLQDALEAKRAQENFMDMVSHEMRNPLNAILQCAEEAGQLLTNLACQESEFPEDLQTTVSEAIETILYCGRHQKQIIDDVLTISKLDSDLLTLSPIETKPSEIVKQACKVFASEIRTSDIQVSHNLSIDACENLVLIDPSRVLQILINLIGNAIKFLKGRPTRKLVVTVNMSRDRPTSTEVNYVPSGRQRNKQTSFMDVTGDNLSFIYFSVEDTGPGLSAEEMDNLFARFKQGSPRTHAQYGGSGLGLFISRQLTELHGGEIGFHSQLNKGSTFAFYVVGQRVKYRKESSNLNLTSHVVQKNSQDNDVSNTAATDVTKLSQRPSNTSSLRNSVLIVEDNLVNQKVLSRQLRNKGFINTTANHGEEALTKIQQSSWWSSNGNNREVQFSIILCDLEMPVMDGITCIRQIRDWQREGLLKSHIPAVAVTGNARSEQISAAKEAGFDDVICKPYSVADLVPLIKRLVNTDE